MTQKSKSISLKTWDVDPLVVLKALQGGKDGDVGDIARSVLSGRREFDARVAQTAAGRDSGGGPGKGP